MNIDICRIIRHREVYINFKNYFFIMVLFYIFVFFFDLFNKELL